MADVAVELIIGVIREVRVLVRAAKELKNTSQKVMQFLECAEIIVVKVRGLSPAQKQEMMAHEYSPLTVLDRCVERVKALLEEVVALEEKRSQFQILGRRMVTKASLKDLLLESGNELNDACDRIANVLAAVIAHEAAGTTDAGADSEWSAEWAGKKESRDKKAAEIPEDTVPTPKTEHVMEAVSVMRTLVQERKRMLDALQQVFIHRSNQTTILLDAATGLRENLNTLEARIKETRARALELQTKLRNQASNIELVADSVQLCVNLLPSTPPGRFNEPPESAKLCKNLCTLAELQRSMHTLMVTAEHFDTAGRPDTPIDVEHELSEEFAALSHAFKHMRHMVDGLGAAASSSGAGETKAAEEEEKGGGADVPLPPPTDTPSGQNQERVLVRHSRGNIPEPIPSYTQLREAASRCSDATRAQAAWMSLETTRDIIFNFGRWHREYADLFAEQMWPCCTRDYQACREQLARVVCQAQATSRMTHPVLHLKTCDAAIEDAVTLAGRITMMIDGVRDRLAQFERIVQGTVWDTVSLMAVADRGDDDPSTLVHLWNMLDRMDLKIDYLRNHMDHSELPESSPFTTSLHIMPSAAEFHADDFDYPGGEV